MYNSNCKLPDMNTCLRNIFMFLLSSFISFSLILKYFRRFIRNSEDCSVPSETVIDSLHQNWADPLCREETVIRKSITYRFVTRQPLILNTSHLFVWIKVIVSLESTAQASNTDQLECQNVLDLFRRHLSSLIICLSLDIKSKYLHLT